MAVSNHNLGFSHKSGILLPISSLPSEYGIGSLGKPAYNFIDFLSQTHQKCWQVLPLNPTSYGDSPYQSPACFAGNPYFIDLKLLYNDGLLSQQELKQAAIGYGSVDYGRLFNERYTVLRKAFSRFKPSRSYSSFCSRNASWLDDYSLFMSLKVHYNFSSWLEWDECHRNCEKARQNISEFKCEMSFWKFLQYEFYTQWRTLISYAHSKGIKIIGDMPIYVAHDSVEVWSEPEQFLLDSDYKPKCVAGCPPDLFSEDGQLWGNPIYDWEKMKNDGFSWWIKRFSAAFKLYDILRIDHFRGFASYYSIPYGESTARNGHWECGYGVELFDELRRCLPKAKIIAEDLGYITDDVRYLLSYTGFPGMKLLQFAFNDDNNEYLPRMYNTDNCIVYTGSHDSDCTRSWIKSLSGDSLQRFNRECPHKKGESRVYDLIRMAMTSRAVLCIVPMQDFLELSNDAGRMNFPSKAEGNWTWRMSKGYASSKLKERIRTLTDTTRRGYQKKK